MCTSTSVRHLSVLGGKCEFKARKPNLSVKLNEALRNAQDLPNHKEHKTRGASEISSVPKENPFTYSHQSLGIKIILEVKV